MFRMKKVHGAILNALLLHIAAQALRQTSNDFFSLCFRCTPHLMQFTLLIFLLSASHRGGGKLSQNFYIVF